MIPDGVKPFVIRKVAGMWTVFSERLPKPVSFFYWDNAIRAVDLLVEVSDLV